MSDKKMRKAWICLHDPEHPIQRCSDPTVVSVLEDRLYTVHYVRIEHSGWKLTHPLDCDLDECRFHQEAMGWLSAPAPVGKYAWRWHEQDPLTWTPVSD